MKTRAPDAMSAVSGAALLMTLFLVAAITLIVVSYLAVARQEVSVSGAVVSDTRARLGQEAAFAEAGALLEALTTGDGYLVTLATRREGAGGPERYTYISTPHPEGITHVPLFAGGEIVEASLPNLDALSTPVLADAPVARPEIRLRGETRTDLIELPPLTGLDEQGRLEMGATRPALGVVELPPVADLPYRTRYTYWIEDLEGYPDPATSGAWTGDADSAAMVHGHAAGDSRVASGAALPLEGGGGILFRFPASHRGQSLVDQAAPGLSPREILLQSWAIPGVAPERHPYNEAALLSAESRQVTGSRFAGVVRGDREPDRFSNGRHPYRRVPLIPYGHGYVDAGKPRQNLNALVAGRDLAIADLVERNLPTFKDRRGGFPPDEDYVATLAANAIDYADADSLPALPGNVKGAGTRVFRGVDSYCPVNEFYVRFRYVGYEAAGKQDLVVFEAMPYAEFWNTSNREVVMNHLRLRFRFLERLRFRTNSLWYEVSDAHRVLDEPFTSPGISVTVRPNHYQVASFGRVRWKVPVPRPALVPFPIVQDLRGVSNASVRAHYELFLGNDRIDQCGRPDPADVPATPKHGFFFTRHQPVFNAGESFIRFAAAALVAEDFGGIPKPVGSHLGDPWMPYFSRSTAQDAQYSLKATPGFRNYDHDKVNANRPDQVTDQVRVRDWPDRGYDSALGGSAPGTDQELPDAFHQAPSVDREAMAPWRISNLGRYHSVTELGHLHDPVMWVPDPGGGSGFSITKPSSMLYGTMRATSLRSLPATAVPGKLWGGGNTLRIGRPEHALFDRPGMRASQWLDLFHVGVPGTNLGPAGIPAEPLYRYHDPRDHQPPPSAPNPVTSRTEPSSLLYDPDLHAQSAYQLAGMLLNLNTAPTRFEIETLLRGPSVSSDVRLRTDHFTTPTYEREGATGRLRSALKEDAIPRIAQGLIEARPFLGPSHLARVFSELLERHDALPAHHNDAEAEEPFARLFNTTTISSRHFRIHAAAEVYHATTGEVVGRSRAVREVFLRPVRDATGTVTDSRIEVLSSRDL